MQKQAPKKPYLSPATKQFAIVMLLCVTFILGVSLYYGILPLILTIAAASVGVGLLTFGVLFAAPHLYKGIKKIKERLPTPAPSTYEEPDYSKQKYTYKPKVEKQATPAHYKPSDKPNLHKDFKDPLKIVASFLTPREVALFKQTDKMVNETIKIENTPSFKAACAAIKDTYPQELIDACGIHNLAALPVLDLVATTTNQRLGNDYINYVNVEQLNGHKAMRGIDPHRRAFISLCLNHSSGPQVVTVFQRYTGDKDFWMKADDGNYGPGLPDPAVDGSNALFLAVAKLLDNTHEKYSLAGQQNKLPPSSPARK